MADKCPACGRAIRKKKPISHADWRKKTKAATMKAIGKSMPKSTVYRGD